MAFLDRSIHGIGGALPHLLDPETRLLQAALSLLSDNGQAGGLAGLREHFQEAGLGGMLDSWIGSDAPLPVTASQIEDALGDGHLRQIAEETGLTEHEAADRLSELLPDLVNRLTPDGRVPAGGVGDLAALLAQFMGRRHAA